MRVLGRQSQIFRTLGELNRIWRCQTFLPASVPSSGLNLRLLPRPFREQRFPKGTAWSLNFRLLGKMECMCAYRGKMWIEAIFQEIIDRDQSRSFTTVSVLPSQSSFPSHRGELAEIGWNFEETQRMEYTRLQGSLFQFIPCYSSKIRVLFLLP